MQRIPAESMPEYVARRVAQEEQAASVAENPVIRDLHLEMARRLRDAIGPDGPARGGPARLVP